jgi:hypothetical protein
VPSTRKLGLRFRSNNTLSEKKMAETPKTFVSSEQTVAAVIGDNTAAGDGVFGIGHGEIGRGVVGTSEKQNGVTGIASDTGLASGE